MKKYFFISLLIFTCQLGYGQSVNTLFSEFGSEPKAEQVTISPFLMSIGKLFIGHIQEAEIARNIKSIRILDLEACPETVQQRFMTQVNKLDREGYETLIRINDKGDNVRILMKKEKNVIRELLLLCTGNNNCSFLCMKGKFTQDEIHALIDRKTGKTHERR